LFTIKNKKKCSNNANEFINNLIFIYSHNNQKIADFVKIKTSVKYNFDFLNLISEKMATKETNYY